MAIWNRCAICGRAIPVGEPCYGVKDWRGDPIGGDTICRDCLVLENEPTLTPPNAVPPCYQPDGDGCAYQCYDGDDEPINKCKECPLCYSDKKRRKPSNEALTIEQLREMVGEPVWVQTPGIPQYGRWVIVAGVDTEYGQSTLYCQGDYTCRNYGRDWIAYRRPPEGEEGT